MTVNKLNEFISIPEKIGKHVNLRFLSNTDILPRIIEMIQTAKNEILLITPWFYQDDIKNLLVQKRKEGVIIKVIVRKFKNRDNKNHLKTIQELDKTGIQVVFFDKIHAKIVIIDECEVIISSKNIIESSAIDMGVWYNIPNEVKNAREEFYFLYNQRFYDL